MQATAAGALAAVVGFASSFAVIISGLTVVGATPAQAASGLMAGGGLMALHTGRAVLSNPQHRRN